MLRLTEKINVHHGTVSVAMIVEKLRTQSNVKEAGYSQHWLPRHAQLAQGLERAREQSYCLLKNRADE